MSTAITARIDGADNSITPYLMSKELAAQYISRSVKTIERHIAQGILPAVRDGKNVLLYRHDLEEFADHLPAWEPRR